MLRFSYQLRPTRVVFGPGAMNDAGAELSRAKLRRAFVVSTPGRAAEIARQQAALGDAAGGLFSLAELHVPAPMVAAAAAECARVAPDCLVSLGGGSAIGLGKALAIETALPLVSIPTTYSGSEMTDIWGITDSRSKRTGRNPEAAPSLVIYDPELTISLPPKVSAESGMNAAAHAVEALYAPDANPVASLFASEALRLLAARLPDIVPAPRDLSVRTDLLLAAHYAGFALSQTSMGLHHKLCHVLGGTFSLPHAATHAAVLPHVVAFNAEGAPDAVAPIARAMGVSDAASALFQLNRRLGLVTALRHLGLRPADVEAAADRVMEAVYPNPRPVTREGVRGILLQALDW